MKKSLLNLLFAGTIAVLSLSPIFADRGAWADAAVPSITKVEQTGPNEVTVSFNSDTSNNGSDGGEVVMTSDVGASKKNMYGKTRRPAKETTFELKKSGTYTFVVNAERDGESTKHESEAKSFKYILPLIKPVLSARNLGEGKVNLEWTGVPESDGYIVSYTDENKKTVSLPATTEQSAQITLPVGTVTNFVVTATRGSEKIASDPLKKTTSKIEERIWEFAEFGTSTKPDYNNFEILDSDNLTVKLNSCEFDPKTGAIINKGGKFETFFDGISFYYTKLDPYKENFELTATVTVDYHNPSADGQEGFGLLAIDRLWKSGESMTIAYNNSAGIISRKYTTHVDGVKKEIKDGLGSRFVSGITDAIIEAGDSEISQKATSISKAFSYDQSSDAIKTGDKYRITLKKDNTGYHAIYKRAIASEDSVEEFIMYDSANKKLTQLDKDNIYVGFAVARGCNATFSDVDLKITDPKTDPVALEEPPELIPLTTLIDCPTTWYNTKYPFVFNSNAKGTITIKDNDGKVLLNAGKVEADVDFKTTLKIKNGINDLLVTFAPEDGWEPAPKSVVAQFNKTLGEYEKNYSAVTYTHSIISKAIKGSKIYVSQNGDVFGDGTKNSPVDLESAILYSKPGQTILLAGGKYYPSRPITIDRGNDGKPNARKVLMSEDPNNRAIIDFSSTKMTVSGISLYGSYWTFKNIDITGTPGDCKGIQVAGNYNQLLMVDAYLNGDTGIQISGRASEPYEKWPHDNLVYGCESFGNADPAQNNADGFAAKLTTGEGNVFRNCVAHHNVDDGWDLYAKIETGPIGAVLIDNCIAYNNGRKIDNSGKGDGNGFKLGGDGIAVKHLIKNSVSFNNDLNGITTNSNPALIVEACSLYGNKDTNLNFYGKGEADKYPRTIKASNILSIEGMGRDKFDESKDPTLKARLESDNNFFFGGAESVNKSGAKLGKESFKDVDYKNIAKGLKEDGKTFNRLPRDENGVFDLGDLFKLTDKVPAGVGANYNGTSFKIPAGSSSKLPIAIVVILVAALACCCIILKKKKTN
ncbi:MAG: right-handed parallel beta-helix repeat-containing protein [Treponema sp.]|nr:right-handed parallel beta-helix repeat-containing protein [Treponema sp.]